MALTTPLLISVALISPAPSMVWPRPLVMIVPLVKSWASLPPPERRRMPPPLIIALLLNWM